MSDLLWSGVVPSISAREGLDVTATVRRTAAGVEVAYSFAGLDQRDVEGERWGAETAAYIADQLRLVQAARRTGEALARAQLDLIDAAQAGCDLEDYATCERAGRRLKEASDDYEKALLALPRSLL